METLRLSSLTEKTEQFGKDDRRIDSYLFMGFKILIGKNALSNEALISEHAKLHKQCIWLHAYGNKGAHVIICSQDKPVPEIVLRRAAGLAAKYSQNKLTDVIWAQLQDVYKPDDGPVGVWKTWKDENVIKL
jgi:predicted ribosome quality control (RQC) complex YloA/Tae2 family protein